MDKSGKIVAVHEVTWDKDKQKPVKKFVGDGRFLSFGLVCEEANNSIASWTAAIVEMSDGFVKCVDPEMIRFCK